MSHNITEEYLEMVKKELSSIMKIILENKYQKKQIDDILNQYIKVRYLGFYNDEEGKNTLKEKIIETFKNKENELIKTNPQNQKDIINVFAFCNYILYFDNVIKSNDILNVIEKIEKLRIELLRKDNSDFKTELYNKVREQEKKKKDFFDKYETNDFGLKISNYKNSPQVYKVKLNYDIDFPMIYSEEAIDKVFKTSIINEDKLLVEYSLISINVIKDIIKQNFTKQYIIEFSASLLKKQKKLKSILNIIENPLIQDKVSLKIKYKEFLENKENVYELLRKGFKMAIVLDDSINVVFSELDKLNVFKYVIVNTKMKKYEEIMKNKIVINNLIEV